jgi:hypothetical protein
MIFPFKIKFEELLNINTQTNTEEIFQVIKESVIGESLNIAKDFVKKDNRLTFKTRMLGGSTTFTMKTIDKAVFDVKIQNGILLLTYTYYIGRFFIYLALFASLLALGSNRPMRITIHSLLALWIITVALSRVSTFIGQKSMVKRVSNSIEEKWGCYQSYL